LELGFTPVQMEEVGHTLQEHVCTTRLDASSMLLSWLSLGILLSPFSAGFSKSGSRCISFSHESQPKESFIS
jgi:hypothetical protein